MAPYRGINKLPAEPVVMILYFLFKYIVASAACHSDAASAFGCSEDLSASGTLEVPEILAVAVHI